MASFNIHLAVGKVYMDNHEIKEKIEFIKGILDPDLAEDDHASHYTVKRTNGTLKEHLQTKVDLKKYLDQNNIQNYYEKGFFLVLLTDYKFFNVFFYECYLVNI